VWDRESEVTGGSVQHAFYVGIDRSDSLFRFEEAKDAVSTLLFDQRCQNNKARWFLSRQICEYISIL
jgi:hypothetical protein